MKKSIFYCDICGKSFQIPVSLRKHHYSHIEESEQFQCRTCDKHFPFESQLKSHRHMHWRIRYYKCASANCDRSFRHPGDLAAHARSHRKPFDWAHCTYSNTDICNLRSHLRVHSRDAPFTCKTCGAKFVHSNQLVRHKLKCEGNKPDAEWTTNITRGNSVTKIDMIRLFYLLFLLLPLLIVCSP